MDGASLPGRGFRPTDEARALREQSPALFRQMILNLSAVVDHDLPGKDAVFYQMCRTIGEYIPRNLEALLKLFEMSHPCEGFAKNQEGPAIAHGEQCKIERALIRADWFRMLVNDHHLYRSGKSEFHNHQPSSEITTTP